MTRSPKCGVCGKPGHYAPKCPLRNKVVAISGAIEERRRLAPNGFGCAHKIASDHHAGTAPNGRRLWKCSCCGAVDVWGVGWMVHGQIECRKCGHQVCDSVACSPSCAEKLHPGAEVIA